MTFPELFAAIAEVLQEKTPARDVSGRPKVPGFTLGLSRGSHDEHVRWTLSLWSTSDTFWGYTPEDLLAEVKAKAVAKPTPLHEVEA